MILKKFIYKKVKSTNELAFYKIKKGFNNGIIMSNEQTNGKGQYGKKWISKKGNLFLSIFYKIKKNSNLSKLTKKNTNLIKKILSQYVKKKIKLKKPNDILVNNKKICGILHETIYFKNYKYLILGIGINISSSPKILNYQTTFINKIIKKKIKKEKIFEKIKNEFEIYSNDYCW